MNQSEFEYYFGRIAGNFQMIKGIRSNTDIIVCFIVAVLVTILYSILNIILTHRKYSIALPHQYYQTVILSNKDFLV